MRPYMSRSVLMGALLVIAIAVSACAALPPLTGGTPAPIGEGAPAAGATVTPAAPGAGSTAVNEIARQTLAQQLGVRVEDIRVVSAGQVDWPNGCLGIQRPDVMCTDAIVPGYQIILEVNGQQYEVRTDLTGRQVAVAPEGSAGAAGDFPAAAQVARQRTAADLGLELGQVTILSVEAAEWPDACLGQPDPTELCAQMITPGFRVTLDANGTQVVYRTDDAGQNIRRERQPQSAAEFPGAAQAARQALSQELGVPVESINIQRADPAEWTDSCLGLGGPAESCLQAITRGYRVFLERDGEQYIYRTDESGQALRREQTEAGEFPAAAQAARDALARQLGVPADQIIIQRADPTEWTDGCLGLGGPAELCLQAITPGYRVTLQYGGQQYIYRTDETGQSLRPETAAAGSAGDTPSGALDDSEPVIGLRRDVDGTCQDVRVSLSGVNFGACGMEMAAGRFLTETFRLEQLQDMQNIFASFGVSTPAGKVTFVGKGPIEASPAEQRMIAEWANLVGQEAQTGIVAGYGFGWKREGGIAGFCDEIAIDASGHAVLRSCRAVPTAPSWKRLTADELTRFYGWLDRFGAAAAEARDPATADAMIINFVFSGRGSEQATEADTSAMMQFAGESLQQWAEATPIRYITTSAEVNIRKGPSEQFEVVETIAAGQQALVTGVSRDSTWWRVVCPDNTAGNCWVTGDARFTQPVAPAGSTGMTQQGEGQPALDETGILAAAVRQVYTVDDTFGGNGKFPVVYLLAVDDAELGAIPYSSPARIVPAPVQQGVVANLTGLPAQFKWVASAGEVKRNSRGEVEGNAAIITVGKIQPQSDGRVHVNASIYVGPMAAGGQTYILEREGDTWKVTGKTGASWIS
jgi:hypothetical protein